MPKASQPSVEAQSSVAAPVSGAVAAVCAKLGDGEMALGRPWCWPRVWCGGGAAPPTALGEHIVGKAAALDHDGVKVGWPRVRAARNVRPCPLVKLSTAGPIPAV
jgi:hypothetical protein